MQNSPTSNQNENLLTVKDLNVTFKLEDGLINALNGVSLEIKKGKTLGVVGESGCGKSVTSQAILRIIPKPGRIDTGVISFFPDDNEPIILTDLDPTGDKIRSIRGNLISMIFQEPMAALSPLHSVESHIIESFQLHNPVSKAQAKEMAFDMLKQVNMPNPDNVMKSYPHQLSGGMCQRVMIAIALICNPMLLIADEPTTALDVTVEAQILDIMRNLQNNLGMSILYISHNLGVIAEIADEVAVMYLGQIVEKANVVEIFHQPKHPYTISLLKSIPKLGKTTRVPLETLTGSVPDAYSIPAGCAFHPRCPAMIPGLCNKLSPAMVNLTEHHTVQCFLYSKKVKHD